MRTKRWREREEKARNFGAPHPSGPHPSGAPPFGAGLAKVGQLRLAKVGLAKVGQIFLAKVGLAKVGFGQSRPMRMAKVGLAKVGLSRDSDAPLVSGGRFAALSDDMTGTLAADN